MPKTQMSNSSQPQRTPTCRASKRLKALGRDARTAELSTGLTPRMSRTRLFPSSPSTSGSTNNNEQRHTTPHPTAGSKNGEQAPCSSPTMDTRSYQYIPFSDIIDARSRRRIGRSGFSEKMNAIEEKKRIERKLQIEKDKELQRLRDELDRLRKGAMEMNDDNDRYDGVESDDSLSSLTSLGSETDHEMRFDEIDGPFADEEATLIASKFPPLVDAGTQVSFHSCRGELQSLKEDLEKKKAERQRLFRGWQEIMRPHNDGGTDGEEALGTPPPDFSVLLINSLRDATSRASEAAETVQKIQKELAGHGFAGVDALEVLNNIGSRFRQARLELERAVPGETANANLSNWSTTIDALVKHISRLVTDIKKAREQMTGYQERDIVLRRQFNTALLRLEEATKKNEGLEKYTETIAEDMLNARIKIQRLDGELQTHATDKRRLMDTLETYREDVKMLERLNEKLEDEISRSKLQIEKLEMANNKLEEKNELSKARIGSLERNLNHEKAFRQRLQDSLEQCNDEIIVFKQQIQQLETEHEEVQSALKEANLRQLQNHEQEIGALRTRLSAILASLNSANTENERLQNYKQQLEHRISDFQHLFSHEAMQAAQARAKETLRLFEDWQKGIETIDDALCNEEVDSQKRQSFCMIGSEPMTPATVSRFKNVEMGRGGKKRKRDAESQIAVLTEEEGEEAWSNRNTPYSASSGVSGPLIDKSPG